MTLFRLGVVVGVLSISAVASAEQQAKVRARLCDLRSAPASDAKSKVKLPAGREVSVLAKSDDSQWVRIKTQSPKGDEFVTFDGWLQASEVAGADMGSLSIGGKAAVAAAQKDTWGSPSSTSTSSTADAGWGGSESKPAPKAAAKTNDGWGGSSASEPKAEAKTAAGEWNFDEPAAPAAEKKSDDSDWDKPAPSSSSSSSSSDSTGGW